MQNIWNRVKVLRWRRDEPTCQILHHLKINFVYSSWRPISSTNYAEFLIRTSIFRVDYRSRVHAYTWVDPATGLAILINISVFPIKISHHYHVPPLETRLTETDVQFVLLFNHGVYNYFDLSTNFCLWCLPASFF